MKSGFYLGIQTQYARLALPFNMMISSFMGFSAYDMIAFFFVTE